MKVRAATEAEVRGGREIFGAMLEAQRRAYETSTGIERHRCLLAALALCPPLVAGATDSDHRVPKWLYEALCEQQADLLKEVKPGIHWIRWMMVREGKRQKRQVLVRGKPQEREWTWPQAHEYASKKLKGTPYSGLPRTMKQSYLIAQNERRRGSHVR